MFYGQSIEFDAPTFITQWFSAILFGLVLSIVLRILDHYRAVGLANKKAKACYLQLYNKLCLAIFEVIKIQSYRQKIDRNAALIRCCELIENATHQYSIDLLSLNMISDEYVTCYKQRTKELIQNSINFSDILAQLSNHESEQIKLQCEKHIREIEAFILETKRR